VAKHATAIFELTFCWRSINNTLGDKPFQRTNDYIDGNGKFDQARQPDTSIGTPPSLFVVER
jgi:hypothetical protein